MNDTPSAGNSGQTTEQTVAEKATRDNGDFNRAALKRHALRMSDKCRGGKFTRVSEEFFNAIEASIEAEIRSKRSDHRTIGLHPAHLPNEEDDFLTGAGKKKLCEAFNQWIGRQIQNKVDQTRVGKTL
jgi:hypothetical protein